MSKKTEDNNAVVFAKHLEFGEKVAFVAVQDDYTICTLSSDIYIFVEVPNPI